MEEFFYKQELLKLSESIWLDKALGISRQLEYENNGKQLVVSKIIQSRATEEKQKRGRLIFKQYLDRPLPTEFQWQ